ncbi:hypothetical protein D3C83_262370 [compost metagenome]
MIASNTAGQRLAVFEAIKNGAMTADDVREAVRTMAAFKGCSPTTVKNNAAWHVAQLRKHGFLAKGGR